MIYVIGYPLLTDEEIIELRYGAIGDEVIHVRTRDIPQLLVELKLFGSKRLARSGTPEYMHRVYDDNEYDVIEWSRKRPWPCVFTFIIGASTEEARDNKIQELKGGA